MNNIPISLAQFKNAIAAIQTVSDFKDDFATFVEGFRNAHPHSYIDMDIYSYPDCADALTNLLENVMHDKADTIGWWCYELEFGTKWKEGDMEDENGNDIPMGTVEDLYQYLVANYEEETSLATVIANTRQIQWERDVALDQLAMLGYKLGQKPRVGRWIESMDIISPHPYSRNWKCSECGCHTRDAAPPFCSNCGAKMVEPQESEEV